MIVISGSMWYEPTPNSIQSDSNPYFTSVPRYGCEVLRSACLYVCLWLSLSVRKQSRKSHVKTSGNFQHVLPVPVAGSFSDDNTMRYVLPVFRMPSRFYITGQIQMQDCSLWHYELFTVSRQVAPLKCDVGRCCRRLPCWTGIWTRMESTTSLVIITEHFLISCHGFWLKRRTVLYDCFDTVKYKQTATLTLSVIIKWTEYNILCQWNVHSLFCPRSTSTRPIVTDRPTNRPSERQTDRHTTLLRL